MLAFRQSNFPNQLFRVVLQRNMTIPVLRIYAHFTVARSSSGGQFVKTFCRIERGKIKSGLKNNWMKKLDRVNRPLDTLKLSDQGENWQHECVSTLPTQKISCELQVAWVSCNSDKFLCLSRYFG